MTVLLERRKLTTCLQFCMLRKCGRPELSKADVLHRILRSCMEPQCQLHTHCLLCQSMCDFAFRGLRLVQDARKPSHEASFVREKPAEAGPKPFLAVYCRGLNILMFPNTATM